MTAGRPCVVQVVGAPCVQTGSFERHLLAVAGEAAERGLATRLVYPQPVADPGFADLLARRAIEVDVLAAAGRLDRRFVAALGRRLQACGAVVVHGHFEPSAPLAAVAARRRGVPSVLTRHHLAAAGPVSRHGLFTRAAGLLVDRHLAVSAPVATSLVRLGVAPGRVAVAHLGVDRDHFRAAGPGERAAARAALGLGADDRVVVTTSHHRPGKGLDVLVDAVARAGVVAVVAGDGPLRVDLEQRAAAAGASVRFTGQVSDVRRLLAAADAFCLPTAGYPEGLPMAALEALASGVPLVATPVPAVVDLLAGHPAAGRVVAAGDSEALAAGLTAATSAAHAGAERWAAAQRAAVRATDDHDLVAWARAVADVYDDLRRPPATMAPVAASLRAGGAP